MSCFNCYSSRNLDSDIIDKILERGQKLRSAMVQSILNTDPFTQEVILNQNPKSLKLEELTQETNDKIKAFLQGDAMSRQDEILILETLRSLSARDLCKATDKTYRSSAPCDCLTCTEYQEKDLKCDLNRASNEITEKIQNKCKTEIVNYLKFVDSVKVSVNSVILNEAGDKKVIDSLRKDKVAGVGQTFFLEYQIPEILFKNNQKNKSKVNSGLDTNLVRLCSRRTNLQSINFKQVSIHDVENLDKINLDEATIIFRLSFRNFKQKQPVFLGIAKFNFTSFEVNKNFVCNQELTIRLNENTPIVVGGLKVSIQLGCGRLYFGREFIDAITNNKENSVILESDDFSSSDSDLTDIARHYYNQNISTYQKEIPEKNKTQPYIPKLRLVPSQTDIESKQKVDKPEIKSVYKKTNLTTGRSVISKKHEIVNLKKPVSGSQKLESVSRKSESIQKPELLDKSTPKFESPVLFGFVYISEAKFQREVMNSFLKCQMFVSEDICESKLVAFDSNPVYNFTQQVPLICDNEFLLKLRENFIIIEFLEKGQKDFLIGISKLSLHQFYLTYRNSVVVKYLSERKLPVIGTDGWESITNPHNGEVVGTAQFLLALGTKEQIDNLEKERGFKNNTVRKKTPISKTVDKAIQSEMEPKKDIESFLNQMVSKKVETNTNTTGPVVRSTSDLLDSLQKALSIDNLKDKKFFKAHVIINNALHLPSRRKCKSKKSKGRNGKHEDILPSTYVTFEDYKGDLKITPIIPKTTSPKWEFQCDVCLPIEYLIDNQKYLVFKVWRKSTNTTMTPNMQVDHVIGFATLDLTVLAAGLPSLQGWYNISDLAKKCNGQINIHITPLENVIKYKSENCCESDQTTPTQPQEPPFEPGELLGRALKRKFTELDEITQRLRLRLSKVTNDESDTSNDEIADEFERDINTLCVEDDFDMVNFENEARNFNESHLKEVGLLQTELHLVESKQKIDQMLEKLSLISGEASSRYVSGCSEGRLDAEALLVELDNNSRPNLYSNATFSREMVEKFGGLLCEVERSGPEGDGGIGEK